MSDLSPDHSKAGKYLNSKLTRGRLSVFGWKVAIVLLLGIWLPLPVFSQVTVKDPLSSGARLSYKIMKDWVLGAAGKLSEENYDFRPTPDVRSFSQLLAHIADENYRICSTVAEERQSIDINIDLGKISRSELKTALVDSFAYCDKVYSTMTDDQGLKITTFEFGGEGLLEPVQIPKLSALALHMGHGLKHYGNISTYLRIKGIIPPSSDFWPHLTIKALPQIPPSLSRSSYLDISGYWILTVTTSNGAIASEFMIKVDGNNVTGEAVSPLGSISFTGTLQDRVLLLTGNLQTIRITLVGSPGTSQMSGTVKFSGRPDGTWTAYRR